MNFTIDIRNFGHNIKVKLFLTNFFGCLILISKKFIRYLHHSSYRHRKYTPTKLQVPGYLTNQTIDIFQKKLYANNTCIFADYQKLFIRGRAVFRTQSNI